NRDGGRNAFHALDLRLVHALQELPCVGGKTFHVAPLTFSVQGVKRQTRFARATPARDDDEFVQGQVQREVLEIILTCANDANSLCRHGSSCAPRLVYSIHTQVSLRLSGRG